MTATSSSEHNQAAAASGDERAPAVETSSDATRPHVQPRFAHLHLHSEYSLLDGGNKLSPLIERVKELGMDAVAVTDHGNMHGAVEFYTKAKAAGVKPILGIEAYVAPGDRTHKKATGVADGGFHLVLLAENNAGWSNLLKLSSDSFANGFYRKPRMDKSTLEQWSDGLIAINGHLGSSLAYHLIKYAQTNNDAHWQAAIEEAQWHQQTFGCNEEGDSRFFIELQSHETPEQERINPHLIKLARQLELPLVCDNDAHFLRAQDWDDHDSLCCISMGKTKDDTTRLHYPRQLYVKSPEQMAELFADVCEAVENSARIADRCNVELDFTANHAPVVDVVHPGARPEYDPARDGADVTAWFKQYCDSFELRPFDAENDEHADEAKLKQDCDRALRDLCEAGLIWRYGVDGITDDIRARLERELKILADKLISAYFLIVWDFVNWARQRGIPSNARGSGVGTMVGYVLGLSNACPERYGLLFERFTDPDRSEYPDIDIDICQDGRAAVIDYVRQKYGHVAQIITFGRLKARAAIKDVARVHGLTPGEGQRLANLVPNELGITIDDALEKEPDLKEQYDSDPIVRKVVDTARALEDHARHAGVHAAGVVVATQPLDNIVPLCKATGSDDIITQWDGPTCEKVGLLKMDFLGLRTLSTIERARTLIAQSMPDDAIWSGVGREAGQGPHPLDVERLSYDDPKVFELFCRADTAGVFQFESGGMRKLLADMKPDRLEDLIAANALFRPGPMDLIPDYCARKHGQQPVPRIHEIVDGFTAETYGIMVYQEQVMQIVHGLGGIPLRSAYSLIKAISKKKHAVIDAERPKFIDGAKDQGLSEAQANELFDLILKFAGYGFNKSHSTGYAIVAYQTAYLKTYFPNQYMAAVLTFESAAKKVDDWVCYLEDCRQTVFPDNTAEQPHVGVRVEPPDVNASQPEFAVVYDEDEPADALHGHVRFGLRAIKNVSSAAIEALVAERDENGRFESLFNFCERLSSRTVGKSTIEALIKAGAFDSVHGTEKRAAMVAAMEDAIAAGQSLADDRRSGQLNMFAAPDVSDDAPSDETESVSQPLPSIPAWNDKIKLELEKDVLGFHVSGHPLEEHEQLLAAYCTDSTRTVADRQHDAPVVIGGMLSEVRLTVTRKNQERMAILRLQDRTGSLEIVAFPRTFAQCGQSMQVDAPVIVVGRMDRTRNEPQVIAETVVPIADASKRLTGRIDITFDGRDGSSPGDGSKRDVLSSQMDMVSGLIKQTATIPPGADARPAEVGVRIVRDDRVISMRSNTLRVVPSPTLIERITQVVGAQGVRLTGCSPRALMQADDRRNGWRRNGGASAKQSSDALVGAK